MTRAIQTVRATFGRDSSFESEIRAGLREARGRLRKDDPDASADVLLELANRFHNLGYPRLVEAMVGELRNLLGDRLTRRSEGWVLNYEALALAAFGSWDREEQALEQMLAIGRSLDDDQLVSTALQNLATLATTTGDYERAIELGLEALDMKHALDDQFAVAQVLINLTTAIATGGDPKTASEMLTKYLKYLEHYGEPGLLSSVHGILGQTATADGSFDVAEHEFRAALRWARKAQDLRKEVLAIQHLAELEGARERWGRATRWYRNAIRRAEVADAPPQLEVLYRGLALALHQADRNEEALTWLEQAQRAADRFDDASLSAGAAADAGALLTLLGRPSDARQPLEHALQVFRDLDDVRGQLHALSNLAVGLSDSGDHKAAEQFLREASDLADAGEERANVLRRLAETLAEDYRPVEAADALTSEIQEAASLGRREQGWRAATGGALVADHGAFQAALGLFDRALEAYRRSRDVERSFQIRNDRALVLTAMERYDDARMELRKCVAAGVRARNRAMELQASLNLAEVERRAGRPGRAFAELDKAASLAQALDDDGAVASEILLRALALVDTDRLDEAATAYRRASALGKRLRDRSVTASALGGLAGIDFRAGRYRLAVSRFRKAVLMAPVTTPQRVEDAAGLVASLSAAGIEEGLDEACQQLVDLAQEIGMETGASLAFGRAGRTWLERGDLETAQSLYAAAIITGAVGGALREAGEMATIRAATVPMFYVIRDARELAADPEELLQGVNEALERDEENATEALRSLFELARELADEQREPGSERQQEDDGQSS